MSEFLGFSHAHIPRGRGVQGTQNFWDLPVLSITNDNQILHGDQTDARKNFYVVDHQCLIIIITFTLRFIQLPLVDNVWQTCVLCWRSKFTTPCRCVEVDGCTDSFGTLVCQNCQFIFYSAVITDILLLKIVTKIVISKHWVRAAIDFNTTTRSGKFWSPAFPKLSTSFFWLRPLIEVETSSFQVIILVVFDELTNKFYFQPDESIDRDHIWLILCDLHAKMLCKKCWCLLHNCVR